MRKKAFAAGLPALLLLSMMAAPAELAAADDSQERYESGQYHKPLTRQEVRSLAQRIDRIVLDGLREAGQRPNQPLEDPRFLRRAYLNIAGRIPSYREAQDFLNGPVNRRRENLINELLASEAHVSHMYNVVADLLRVKEQLSGQVDGRPYIDYVKRSIRENKPWDEFVYELLTAEGRIDEDGAAGWYLRDSGMSLCNTSNTVRTFLGTSIGCAQCHDHPFDKWSQLEFYNMAAFTYQTRTRRQTEKVKRLRKLAREYNDRSEENNDRADQIAQILSNTATALSYEVHDTNREVRLPHDYKYSDAKPGQEVEPFTIFGELVEEPAEGKTLRETYAAWMTSKENPRFARVIANRLWKEAFGVGVFEPVDEITATTEPYNPELMDFLEQLMKDLDFDLRQFQRVIYNTRTWQREAERDQRDPEEPYLFPGPELRRLSAEQVWDSVVTLAVPNPDERERPTEPQRDFGQMEVEEIVAYAEQQAEGEGQEMMSSMQRERFRPGMRRASEMRQPAPPGHFLYRFGQSDRELINNYRREPSQTQVLTLMNGPIDNVLLKERSLLQENVRRAGSLGSKIEVIWVSILSRKPTRLERRYAMEEVSATGDEAFANLVWALLNTREFLFLQ